MEPDRFDPISEGLFPRHTPVSFWIRKTSRCPSCRDETAHDLYEAIVGRWAGFQLPFGRNSTAGKVGTKSLWAFCVACGEATDLGEPAAFDAATDLGEPAAFDAATEPTEEKVDSDEHERFAELVVEATNELFEELPDDLDAVHLVLASAAQDIAATGLDTLAAAYETWWRLGKPETKGFIRRAAGYYVHAASQDDVLRANFAEWLDLRPSEVASTLLNTYACACLTSSETDLLLAMAEAWDDKDSQRFGFAVMRLVYGVAPEDGSLPIGEALEWRTVLFAFRESFGTYFLAELERYANG